MYIKVEGLTKSFGSFQAVKGVSFEIQDGKLVGFLGPSGGGKTTILRMLAGLEFPDDGEILFDDVRVNDLPPQKRNIGFVFQNYALFRHMSVFDNIAFGLTVQKRKKEEIRRRVEHLIELTGLQGLERRLPHQLSGGQRQRVAFARALAPEPKLLLLDEPFAAIDAKVRKELRIWLRDMIRQVGVTTVFVTHDQEEAVEIADDILIMSQGKIEQHGSPLAIYREPATPFVASFIGEIIELSDASSLTGFEDMGQSGKAYVRPEFIEAGDEHEISDRNAAERGIVKAVYFRGRSWQIDVQVGRNRITVYRSLEQRTWKVNDEVLVLIHRIYRFDRNRCEVVENGMKSLVRV